MSAIDMIREQAAAGQLSAFDCMRLMNSISIALDTMPESAEHREASFATVRAAYALMLMDKQQKGEA